MKNILCVYISRDETQSTSEQSEYWLAWQACQLNLDNSTVLFNILLQFECAGEFHDTITIYEFILNAAECGARWLVVFKALMQSVFTSEIESSENHFDFLPLKPMQNWMHHHALCTWHTRFSCWLYAIIQILIKTFVWKKTLNFSAMNWMEILKLWMEQKRTSQRMLHRKGRK